MGNARWRVVFSGFCGIALVLASTTAWSNKNGRSGYSGKYGKNCNECHNGGLAPQVTIEGPKELDAGVIADYVMRVKTLQPLAGMNVAADENIVIQDDDGGTTRVSSDEVVHPRPLATDGGDGGEAVFHFSMSSPMYGGTYTIYGAGNAVNGNDDTSGDLASTTLFTLTVNGPPAPEPDSGPPPPPPPPPIDAGPGTPPDSGGGGQTTAPVSPAKPQTFDDPGCSIGYGGGSGPMVPGGAAIVLGMLVTRILARRRKA